MGSTSFRKLPIKRKLVLVSILIAGGALLVFTLVSAFTQIRIMRQAMLDNLMILSESIADLSSAALSFADRQGGAEILSSLQADQGIELAVIYDASGLPFASYFKNGEVGNPDPPQQRFPDRQGFIFQGNRYLLEIYKPVRLQEKSLGTVYLLSNTERMAAYLRHSVGLLILSMVVVLGIAVVISSRLQGLITRPISLLAKTARNISEMGDYSLRVEKNSDDEIGRLIDDFNTMLNGIQERDAELQQHRQNLEVLVAERTEELRGKRDEALAAAQAKSEFLANMSHEIRTPMNGVIGVLSLLRDVPMSAEYRRLLDTAGRSADSLLVIINDILDFSKIDAGKITFESIGFNLRELMEESSELFIDPLNLKNLDLTCFVPAATPCRLAGDPTRLRQVITNLLSNAVKFTDRGEIHLRAEALGRQGNQLELQFTVEDSGIGIAENVIGRLFEKFTQADGSTTRKYGGTGLGLSVCKQLVEQQGGKIGVRGTAGRGATFWFSLPFTIVEDSCPIIPYRRLRGKRFLLADDSLTNRAIIENYLHFCDARVESCPDGQSCLARLEGLRQRGERCHGLLIDHHLTDMAGLELAQTISEKYGAAAPAIVLMGNTTFIRAQLRKSGVQTALRKPVRQLDLYNSLAPATENEQWTSPPTEKKEQGTLFYDLRGSVLLVDDEPINQKIAMAILEKFGLRAEVATSGEEAVRLTAQKDYSVVLMDIQMPEISGYEATELIRRREENQGRKRSVIIAMTANAMESTRVRCLEAGMDDFFTKPIKPDVLAARLLPWLSAGSEVDGNAADRNKKTAPETAVTGWSMWDRDKAMGFVGGDEGLFRELVELFLQRNDLLLTSIGDAVRSGNAMALRESAHAYKGAVSHVAAEYPRQLAMTLESMGKNGITGGSGDIYRQLREAVSRLVEELNEYLQTSSS